MAETCAALIAGRNEGHDSLEQMAVRLLGSMPELQTQACVKGKFFDRMQAKLKQLTADDSNELVRIDLQVMADAMAVSGDSDGRFRYDIDRSSSRQP